MKKMYVVTLLLLLMFTIPTVSVSANSGPPIIGITVMPDVCENDPESEEDSMFPGNIDILVRTEDFESDDFGSMSDKYKEYYPFFDNIDYLDSMGTVLVRFMKMTIVGDIVVIFVECSLGKTIK